MAVYGKARERNANISNIRKKTNNATFSRQPLVLLCGLIGLDFIAALSAINKMEKLNVQKT